LALISVPGVICLWPHCRHFYNAKGWPWLIKMPTQVATLRWSLWDFVFGKKNGFSTYKATNYLFTPSITTVIATKTCKLVAFCWLKSGFAIGYMDFVMLWVDYCLG